MANLIQYINWWRWRQIYLFIFELRVRRVEEPELIQSTEGCQINVDS